MANVLPQHPSVRTLLGAIELGKPKIGQIQQPAATALLLASIYLIRYLQCLGAGTLRIGEYMQAAERNLVPQEAVAILEEFRFLTSRSYNDIYPDEGVGQCPADMLHSLPKESRIVPTAHELEHIVGSALKRHMEMWSNTVCRGTEVNKFVGEEIWFDRTDSVSLDAFHLVQSTQEIEECLPRTAPEVTYIDSRKYDLLSSLRLRPQPVGRETLSTRFGCVRELWVLCSKSSGSRIRPAL